jgi:hypothetical protein
MKTTLNGTIEIESVSDVYTISESKGKYYISSLLGYNSERGYDSITKCLTVLHRLIDSNEGFKTK